MGADPGCGLANAHLRLGGRVLRLDDLFLGAERLDLHRELALSLDELLLLGLERLTLLHDPLELTLDRGLAGERLACEILSVHLERLEGLTVKLLGLLLHRGVLHLEPFLGGRDVGDPAFDVLELAELLLVGSSRERLGRVFGAVEQSSRTSTSRSASCDQSSLASVLPDASFSP